MFNYEAFWDEQQSKPLLEPVNIIDGIPWFKGCDCMGVGRGLSHASHCSLWGRKTKYGDLGRAPTKNLGEL